MTPSARPTHSRCCTDAGSRSARPRDAIAAPATSASGMGGLLVLPAPSRLPGKVVSRVRRERRNAASQHCLELCASVSCLEPVPLCGDSGVNVTETRQSRHGVAYLPHRGSRSSEQFLGAGMSGPHGNPLQVCTIRLWVGGNKDLASANCRMKRCRGRVDQGRLTARERGRAPGRQATWSTRPSRWAIAAASPRPLAPSLARMFDT